MSAHKRNNEGEEASQQPPRKRTAAESAHGARARFMRELEQYASDGEDELAAVARTNGTRGLASDLLRHSLTAGLSSSTVTAAPPPSAGPASSDFFFGQSAEHDADDDADTTGLGTSASRAGPSTSSAGASAPARIGLQLLHRMHADGSTTGSPSTAHPSSPATTTSSGGFEVVRSYVPLSTGGFLSTAAAGDDAMEGHQVRIGDILLLRKPRDGTAQQQQQPLRASPAPAVKTATAAVSTGTPASSPTTGTTPSATLPASPNSEATSSTSVEAVAQKAMRHFRAAALFSAEEQQFGQRLSPDMVRLLFEVARVDQQGRSVEALFLDGTRAKLAFREIRPAGYVERAMYARWKADPASRPVTTMHSNASSPTTASAPGTAPASPVVGNGGATSPLPSSGTTTAAAAWWVIPRLLVRVSAESAGDWYGKKCVVKAVRRGENAIRLTEWQGDEGTTTTGSTAAETRELIGVEGLETVVPKKGGRAIVVLGPLRGEMCTVRTRVRDAEGDLTGVEVEINRTKAVVTLQAEELCALAR